MVKVIWPWEESEIKKGRWKITKHLDQEIKVKVERIFLKVFGHPLYNKDCVVYFAKMLYMQFVQGTNVDTSQNKSMAAHMICTKK